MLKKMQEEKEKNENNFSLFSMFEFRIIPYLKGLVI